VAFGRVGGRVAKSRWLDLKLAAPECDASVRLAPLINIRQGP